MIIDTALTVNPKEKRKTYTQVLTLMSNKGNLRVMFTKKTLCAALKFAQMENHPIKTLELLKKQQHKHAMSFG